MAQRVSKKENHLTRRMMRNLLNRQNRSLITVRKNRLKLCMLLIHRLWNPQFTKYENCETPQTISDDTACVLEMASSFSVQHVSGRSEKI